MNIVDGEPRIDYLIVAVVGIIVAIAAPIVFKVIFGW